MFISFKHPSYTRRIYNQSHINVITMENSMQLKRNTVNNTLIRKKRKRDKTCKKEVLEKAIP